MSFWNSYPSDYRSKEVQQILRSTGAGESVAVVGLSGSGKSNLLGFMAHRTDILSADTSGPILQTPRYILVDCNRLADSSSEAFFSLLQHLLIAESGEDSQDSHLGASFDTVLQRYLVGGKKLCLLLDRFDALYEQPFFSGVASNLRAWRDMHKYQLSYVIATRKALDPQTELAELFFGHTLWLGPLSKSNAFWSARRDAARFTGQAEGWGEEIIAKLVEFSWGYPSLLRACCEAYAAGIDLDFNAFASHPAVLRRVSEFWSDEPGDDALKKAGLLGQPLLNRGLVEPGRKFAIELSQLTAKENSLLEHLRSRAGLVCEKDELIRAIWPEDVIYEQGVRDDSLAQLVRRLRVKIEPDPSQPVYIQTIPGRGYLFRENY